MNNLEHLRKQISEVKATAVREEEDSDVRRIYHYCVHLLARQDYSEFKLRQKLRSKPQNLPHQIDEAIELVKSEGLLREEAYRRLFIRKWMMKGESEDKIRKRGALEKLCFENHEFEACQHELGFSDENSIDKLVTKKLRGKAIPSTPAEKYKLRDKVLRFLISKGYSFEDSRQTLTKYFSGSYELE